jgi:ATP-dependent exoDNAse (exonuclease V) beta subunit
MEEGLLPHKRSIADLKGLAIAEERRLCYVGVTRARDTLTLSYCKARMKWGVERPQIPSRFLMEMRGDLERARKAAEAAEKALAEEFGRPGASRNGAGAPGKASSTSSRKKASGGSVPA